MNVETSNSFPLILISIYITLLFASCKEIGQPIRQKGTFGYDRDFLLEYDPHLITLGHNNSDSRILVSALYQGKVFTSTSNGSDGKSYGWVNYSAFGDSINPHMNAYGGENRYWLGPEGGVFSLYFDPGEDMIFDNWSTPAVIDTEPWDLVQSDAMSARLRKEALLTNYQNYDFKMLLEREVYMISPDKIEKFIGNSLKKIEVQAVAYHTVNSLQNTGNFAWDKTTGAPCIWILDMFQPSPETTVVVPFDETGDTKIATTDYFGVIPDDRIQIDKGFIFFKADGLFRSKLGLTEQRAKPMAGSYDEKNQVLTITTFDIQKGGIYLNQEWTTKSNPFIGDVVNSYNDGPLENGSQLGPFYEIESISPAALLDLGEKISHRHSVYHFEGEEKGLDLISKQLLGIGLEEIKSKF